MSSRIVPRVPLTKIGRIFSNCHEPSTSRSCSRYYSSSKIYLFGNFGFATSLVLDCIRMRSRRLVRVRQGTLQSYDGECNQLKFCGSAFAVYSSFPSGRESRGEKVAQLGMSNSSIPHGRHSQKRMKRV
jgi:hypothetical protein